MWMRCRAHAAGVRTHLDTQYLCRATNVLCSWSLRSLKSRSLFIKNVCCNNFATNLDRCVFSSCTFTLKIFDPKLVLTWGWKQAISIKNFLTLWVGFNRIHNLIDQIVKLKHFFCSNKIYEIIIRDIFSALVKFQFFLLVFALSLN